MVWTPWDGMGKRANATGSSCAIDPSNERGCVPTLAGATRP